MSRLCVMATAAGLFALAGCAGRVIVYQPVYEQVYYDGALELAASRGEVLVEVEGNPTGGQKAQFDDFVAQSMIGANFGPRVTYTTRHSERIYEGYKVVMVFNGPVDQSPSELCKEQRKPIKGGPLQSGVALQAVFCQFETPISEAGGAVYDGATSDQPTLRELVREVTAALFPVYDFKQDNGSGDNFPG